MSKKFSKKHILLGLLVLCLVAAGAIFFWSGIFGAGGGNSNSDQTAVFPAGGESLKGEHAAVLSQEDDHEDHRHEHTVVLRSGGFVPEELTITQGDTVIFMSMLGREFWPASDIHPSHEIYSEFDPKEPIAAGERWSFRFNAQGRWRYHDHRLAIVSGMITVLGENQLEEIAAPISLSQCEEVEASAKPKCWNDVLSATLSTKGLATAFQVFRDLYATDPSVPKSCHGWGHVLGEAAFHLFDTGEDFRLVPETAYCGYGFFHGLVEAALLNGYTLQKVRTFCDYAAQQMEFSEVTYRNCIHGIGHGSVAVEDPWLWGDFQAMTDPGLEVCEAFSAKPFEQEKCLEGVFNAMHLNLLNEEYGLKMNREDHFRFCRQQKEQHRPPCYYEFSGYLSTLTGHDFDRAAQLMLKDVPDPEIAGHLIRKIAGDFMEKDIVKPDYRENVLACRSLPEFLFTPCLEGIIVGLLGHGKPEQEHVKALRFCGSDVPVGEERKFCYTHLFKVLRREYVSEKVSELCSTIEEEYRGHCLFTPES